MPNLLGQDDFQTGNAGLIADAAQTLDHAGSNVKAARLEHAWHQRHAHQRVVCGLFGHVPEPVVGRQITIAGAQFIESLTQYPEMPRLVESDAEPVDLKGCWHVGEAQCGIERKVDRVELDVRNRMKQGDATLDRAQTTPRQLAWPHQNRLWRTACGRRSKLRRRRAEPGGLSQQGFNMIDAQTLRAWIGLGQGRGDLNPEACARHQDAWIASTRASAKPEVETSVALLIWRAKS